MFSVVKYRFFARFGFFYSTARRMADYRPRPCVLCGPSGSGKSTLIKRLMEEYRDYFGFSVSHTTRKPRPGEQDGVHYHYTNREWMENAIKHDKFIESAEFSANLYGTSKKSVEDVRDHKKICILDIDMQGVIQIQQTNLNPIYIFIKPPNMNVLEERLRNRKTDTEEAIQRRLDIARREMDFISHQQNTGHTIVNDNVESAYQSMKSALLEEIQRLKDDKDEPKT